MKKFLLFFVLSLSICYIQAQTVAPPLNMTLHAQWDADTLPTAGGREYNDIWGWVDCSGNEYAIMGSAAYIHFFDVTNKDTIIEKGFFEAGQVGTWRDMKTFRDRAYAVSENSAEGMMIFDLSNIQDTIIKTYQSTEFFSRAHNIFIDTEAGRLYAVGTNSQSSGVIILDIATDPDNPILLSSVSLPGGGYIHDIYVKDNIAYASHGYNGFYIWDFTDPVNPVFLSNISTSGYNHSSWLTTDGQHIIYAEEVPLGLPMGILDISDMLNGNISEVTTFKFPLLAPDHLNNVPHNPFVRGDYAIVSYYHDGIQIFDLSDLQNPVPVAYYDSHANDAYSGYSGCWGVYPFFPSGTIIASDINEGLLVLTADSLTFETVNSTSFPDATLTSTSSDSICQGDVAILEANTGASSYEWYKNGELLSENQSSLEVEASGDYYVVVSNGHCAASSEVISITVNPNPDAAILISGETISQDESSAFICEGTTISLSVAEDPNAIYQWYEDGGISSTEYFLDVSTAGSYNVQITNAEGCNSESEEIIVTVSEISAAITFEDGLLTQINPAASYQWYLNGNPITGADSMVFTPLENGAYYCEITDELDCIAVSNIIDVILSSVDGIPSIEHFSIFPNPVKDEINLKLQFGESTEFEIQFIRTDGSVLHTISKSLNGSELISIDVRQFPAGIYFINLKSGKGQLMKKMVKF